MRLSTKRPDQLLVVTRTASQNMMVVYVWGRSEWRRQWSSSWPYYPGYPIPSRFTYIGARPLMGGAAQDVVTTYQTELAAHPVTQVIIWRWDGRALRDTLTMQSPGGMQVSVALDRHALQVRGSYNPSADACTACLQTIAATVRYTQGHWSGTPLAAYRDLLYGFPPAKPSVTFGTGFNVASFRLTGVSSTFSTNADVYWLLNDPSSAFDTTTIEQQLYQVEGATDRLMGTSTVTVNPQDHEVANNVGTLLFGTYELVFIIHNKVLASGTFTIN